MNKHYNSGIGEFFTIKYDDNGKRVSGTCKLCPNKVIRDELPANYWKHIKNNHYRAHTQYKDSKHPNFNNRNSENNDDNDEGLSDCEPKYEENDGIMLDDPVISRKRVRPSEFKQKSIDFPSISSSKLERFHELSAEIFAKLGFPHQLVENKDFRLLINEYSKLQCSETLKFATRRQQKERILAVGRRKFAEIIQILQDNQSFVTLAIDGWTGHTFGAKNTNILAICNGKSYLLWSDRNSDEKDATDSYLFPLVHEKIQFLLSKNIAVCAITTDNAPNMLNIGNQLYKLPGSGPVILHLSCSAHTIQLILQEIAALDPINNVIEQALGIIEPFTTKNGKALRLELRKTQILAGKTPLKLVMFNKTRWLSRFETINRLIQLKSQIKWVFNSCSVPGFGEIQQETWWNKVENVIQPLLKCFKLATNMVQADSATLLTLDQALTGIRKGIDESKLVEHKICASRAETLFKFHANEILNEKIRCFVLANGCHYAFWAVRN
jgi:hypothetical protein